MPLLDLFWAMLVFFLFVLWVWIVISVVIDIFRSEMSGFGKALWVIFVVVIPWLGVLVYLIANGSDMQKRSMDHAIKQRQMQQEYMAAMSGGASTADELEKLKDLHDRGVITDEEWAAQKAKVLG